MSKPSSGLFSGTSGSEALKKANKPQSKKKASIKAASLKNVIQWAHNKANELHGKEKKKFNTAAVVYDETTDRYYYGRNGGYLDDNYQPNPILFGNENIEGILPKQSLNIYPVGNCAEVDAVNQALNDRADLKNLHITTIHVTKNRFGEYKPACKNCTYTFKGRIKENYSGWFEE